METEERDKLKYQWHPAKQEKLLNMLKLFHSTNGKPIDS